MHEFRLAINALEDSYQLKINGLKEKLDTLKAHNLDLDRQKEIIDRQVLTQIRYSQDIFSKIIIKVDEADKILRRQVFSQQMCENLINDLLDLAKLEKSSFKFDNDYFSLPGIIFQAFQILGFSASERCVDLRAKIDYKENLNLIESIHGDQRRFLQIFLNFLSNSLKFTDKGGKITVDIKVLDH